MNITILGAAGRTGLELVKQALEAGHSVSALVRKEDNLEIIDKNLAVFVGDATKASDIAKASNGSSLIISTIGGMDNNLMTNVVDAAIEASQISQVKRFILMSSFAVRTSQLSGGAKLMSGLMMGKMVKDKSTSEAALRSSDLDWTVVYATLLTNDPKTGTEHVVAPNETIGMSNKIGRANVADWILKEAANGQYTKQDVVITDK